MKIYYDAQIFRKQRFGGISRYFCEVASRLAREPGIHARIVAPHHRNAYLEHVPQGTLLGWGEPSSSLWTGASTQMARLLARASMALGRPDVLHETYYSDSWAKPARTLRVLTIYDMIHERCAAHFGPQDRTAEAKRLAVQRADHIVCISESTRQDVIDILGITPDRLSVIHLAAHLRPAAAPAKVEGPPYLLYVGLRDGYKNFMGLAAAVAASPVLRQLQIVCFGGGHLREDELARIDALGLPRDRIQVRGGSDEELAALYAGALCFVYPSLYEGFGIPPLEAMLCGCPVVCANTSSIPEVVSDAGAYFDPQDSDSIRHALEEVTQSPQRQADLRQRGRDVVARFSWDICADRHRALYRQLVAQGGSRA